MTSRWPMYSSSVRGRRVPSTTRSASSPRSADRMRERSSAIGAESSMPDDHFARLFYIVGSAAPERSPTTRLGLRRYDAAMRLSRRSEYGLRALTDLVRHSDDGPIALATLADRNRLPVKFLEQIMATLKHAGHRPDDARRARRLRHRRGSVDGLARARHPAARRRARAARLRVAPLLRAVLLPRRGHLRAARHDDRRPRRDARDPRQGDAGRPGRPARARRSIDPTGRHADALAGRRP